MNKFLFVIFGFMTIVVTGCKYSKFERLENRLGDDGYIIICDKNICQGTIDGAINRHKSICCKAGFTDDICSNIMDVDGVCCTVFTTAKPVSTNEIVYRTSPYAQVEVLQLQLDIANAMLEQYTNNVKTVHNFSTEY